MKRTQGRGGGQPAAASVRVLPVLRRIKQRGCQGPAVRNQKSGILPPPPWGADWPGDTVDDDWPQALAASLSPQPRAIGHEAHHHRHPAGEAPRRQGRPLPRRGHRHHHLPGQRSWRREGARRACTAPRAWCSSFARRSRSRWSAPSRSSSRRIKAILCFGPHRRGGRRQDLRAADRAGRSASAPESATTPP